MIFFGLFLSGYLSYAENVPYVPPNCNGQVPIPVQWVDQTPTSEKEIISSKDKKRLRKTERKSIKDRDEARYNEKEKEENEGKGREKRYTNKTNRRKKYIITQCRKGKGVADRSKVYNDKKIVTP